MTTSKRDSEDYVPKKWDKKEDFLLDKDNGPIYTEAEKIRREKNEKKR